KDRTGVAVALLLEAAGAEREVVVADYTRSQDELAGPWAERMLEGMRAAGIPALPEIAQLAVATPASAIEAALAAVDARGGAAADLRSGGLGEDGLARLRSRLRGDAGAWAGARRRLRRAGAHGQGPRALRPSPSGHLVDVRGPGVAGREVSAGFESALDPLHPDLGADGLRRLPLRPAGRIDQRLAKRLRRL